MNTPAFTKEGFDTHDLEDHALHYWAARAAGYSDHEICWRESDGGFWIMGDYDFGFHPSESWEQAGELIEQHHINVFSDGDYWRAECGKYIPGDGYEFSEGGHTPLVAIVRCFVATKYGVGLDIEDIKP